MTLTVAQSDGIWLSARTTYDVFIAEEEARFLRPHLLTMLALYRGQIPPAVLDELAQLVPGGVEKLDQLIAELSKGF